MLLQSLAATADSGKAPGLAETTGIGAAAEHIAMSGEAGAGLQTVSEAKHADVSADAMRMADLIAKQMAKVGGT